ncbi:MAG: gluconokinase [Nitrososphaerota archaeon]|nr:gluconokinase [Nitrososphaerota archaeon]
MRILAVDIGTGSVKAAVFEDSFRLSSIARVELEVGAEQNPEAMYRSFVEACRTISRDSKYRSVDALVLSGQMHGLVCIGGDGTLLTMLHTYIDTRSAAAAKFIEDKVDGYKLYTETGCPPLFIYPLAKLLWLRSAKPYIFSDTRWFLSAKDYIIYRLIGEPYIDRSTASGSQLLNIHSLDWNDTSLDLAGIDESRLPKLCDGEKPLVELPKGVASNLGLDCTPPIFLGASDGALHSLGVGAVTDGLAAVNLGTSGAFRLSSRRPVVDRSRSMRFFCYYLGYGIWIPGGAVNNAGLCLRWFRDNILGSRYGYDELVSEAESVDLDRLNPLILPFLSGERFPVRDPYAKALFFGLTLDHRKGHIVRALMEAPIYTLRWIEDSMKENMLNARVARIGGGGSSSKLWRRICSGILNLRVEYVGFEESSLMGAAILAALGLGYHSSIGEALNVAIDVADVDDPVSYEVEVYEERYRLYRRLYETVSPLYRS